MIPAALQMCGRFGNQCFQWAHAKSYCEQNNLELRTPEWIGEKLFTLDGHAPVRPDGSEDIILSGYFQDHVSINYTRSDCRRWFTMRPEVARAAQHCQPLCNPLLAHRRVGDYIGHGFPVISEAAYRNAVFDAGFNPGRLHFITEENPTRSDFFDELGAPFFPDFVRLMSADVLFRGNSTFSWWSSTLGNGETWAPIITGLEGGREHDNVLFVKGNWPRCADLHMVTDLYLKP